MGVGIVDVVEGVMHQDAVEVKEDEGALQMDSVVLIGGFRCIVVLHWVAGAGECIAGGGEAVAAGVVKGSDIAQGEVLGGQLSVAPAVGAMISDERCLLFFRKVVFVVHGGTITNA